MTEGRDVEGLQMRVHSLECALREEVAWKELRTHQRDKALIEVERLRGLLSVGAELLDLAAHDIDGMFPGDPHPEMQDDLRLAASKFRALADQARGEEGER